MQRIRGLCVWSALGSIAVPTGGLTKRISCHDGDRECNSKQTESTGRIRRLSRAAQQPKSIQPAELNEGEAAGCSIDREWREQSSLSRVLGSNLPGRQANGLAGGFI
jgi:hypothetical protein